MHDIDRTTGEFSSEADEYEFSDEFSFGEQEGIFNENEENELAAQFLEITDESELDQFLGDFFKKAVKVVGNVVKSPVGKAVGGFLKNTAKKYLPQVGGAIGSYFGGAAGGKAGSSLASNLGGMLGLEAEGMDSEEQEFNAAKKFIKFAGTALNHAAAAAPNTPPPVAAKNAILAAAKQFAPGLFSEVGGNGSGGGGARAGGSAGIAASSGGSGHSGRWIRRGRKIILMGV